MIKLKALPLIALTLAACNDHNAATVRSENPKDLDADCETQSDSSGIRLKCSNGVAVRLAAIDLERFRGPAGAQGAAAPALPVAPKLRAYDANGMQLGDELLSIPASAAGPIIWDSANALAIPYSAVGQVLPSNAFYASTDCSGASYVSASVPQGSVTRIGTLPAQWRVTEPTVSLVMASYSTNGTTCLAQAFNPALRWSEVIPYSNANVPTQIALPLSLKLN